MNATADYTIEDVKREAAVKQVSLYILKKCSLLFLSWEVKNTVSSIDQIKEVVLTPKIAKMPQTPEYIKGVANIRGNIIAIMDLEQKFGLVKHKLNETAQHANYTLVVESEAYKVGVLVKEVPNTLSINVSDIDTASGFIQHSSFDANSLIGVVKSGERMIILIDMLKLIETDNVKETIA